MIWNGMLQSEDYAFDTTVNGTLKPGMADYLGGASFTLPQDVTLVTCSVKWSSVPGTLVDLSMYDPTGTSKSTSLATTDMGNAAVVANPIAGTWTVDLGYGNPTLPARPPPTRSTSTTSGPSRSTASPRRRTPPLR